MLDEKDLLAFQKIITQSIGESESRMMSRMDQLDSRMDKIESRMDQLDSRIETTESHLKAYMEAAVLPKFDLLADQQKLFLETKAPLSRVEDLEEEVAFLKPLVLSTLTEVDKLKKAQ